MNKVLLVDDEATCLEFLAFALQAEGFDVQSCTNASQAIAIGRTFQPDYLVTDWMLKDDRDGLDIAREFSTMSPHTKVIFVTGMEKDLLTEQAKDVQCKAILVKPIDLDCVIALLR